MRNSKALYVALAALVVASGFILRSAWDYVPQARAQADCTEVESFQGTGIQETPPFQVQSNTWRISYNWSATNEEFGGIFQIYANNAETNDLVSIVSAEEPGSGESFVNEGAGRYYLKINTASAEWTVKVEDCGQRDGGGGGGGGTTPTPTPTPPPPPPLPPKAGGPIKGPVPPMPNGTCPKEFPTRQDRACY